MTPHTTGGGVQTDFGATLWSRSMCVTRLHRKLIRAVESVRWSWINVLTCGAAVKPFTGSQPNGDSSSVLIHAPIRRSKS